MGTVLKILGILFIGYWLMVIVGCSMLVSAVQHAAKNPPPRSSYSSSSDPSVARQEAANRIMREIEADRERERNAPAYDENAGERPHFKPGEPMVDPNPGSSDD